MNPGDSIPWADVPENALVHGQLHQDDPLSWYFLYRRAGNRSALLGKLVRGDGEHAGDGPRISWPPAAGSWDILAEAGVAECTIVATDVLVELDEAEANRIAHEFMDARGYFAPLQGT